MMEAHGGELRADMLLLPHHGEWTPALERLVKVVRPRFAVASTGSRREVRRTARMLGRMGVPLWVTARDGAVTVSRGAEALQVEGDPSGLGRRFRLEK